MEKQRGIKVLSVVALIVAVLGLTIAFAALSTTLNITGTGSVKGNKVGDSTWDVHFVENSLNVDLSGTTTETTAPELSATSISDYKVSLAKPGDKVTYTFDVVNAGSTPAKISAFELPVPKCEGDAADVVKICGDESHDSNLSYTLKYEDDGTVVGANDKLGSNETTTMVLTLEYVNKSDVQELPTGNVAIGNLGFSIVYIED